MSEPSVLIVDDHAGFRSLLESHILTRWPGARVTGCDPGAEGRAPESFAGGAHDVVLLDYQLGPRNGLDYLRCFRTIPGFPPVIMLTGEGNERLAVEALKLGAVDYVPKQTMTHDDLIRVMQEALAARGTAERFDDVRPAPARRVEIKGLRILRAIGEGNMATVFLAERVATGEQLVVKVFDQARASDRYEVSMERFAREYDIVRRLDHPSIVRLFEQGFTDEYAFIAMEYFPHGSLRERLRQGIVPYEALEYADGIAAALEVVHAAGVVHRDLKPANVMFGEDGRVVLIDFGIAKALGEASDLTRAGTAMGTPHYMSPEQVQGQAPDARSDLYGLGAMLFEMLAGQVPYRAGTPLAVMYKHVHAPVPALPAPLAALQGLVDRFLAKAPPDRFQSAAQVRSALRAAQERLA